MASQGFRSKPVRESCGVLKIASRSSVTAASLLSREPGGHRCLIFQLISRRASYSSAPISELFIFKHTRSSRDDCARSANGISGSQRAAALSSLAADDDREEDSHRLVFLSASLKPSERHPTTKQHRAVTWIFTSFRFSTLPIFKRLQKSRPSKALI